MGKLACLVFVYVSTARAQIYLDNIAPGHPAIDYFAAPLASAIKTPPRSAHPTVLGYLSALLEQLGISPDSQALVFSKTSVQAPEISPANPRAIYFNDDTAVGFVPGSNELEIARLDPTQGVQFYTLNIQTSALRRAATCLRCHQGPATLGVPGMFVGSVFPNANGSPSPVGAIVTDHRTPFENRWGGWFVDAARGEPYARANAIAPDPAEPETLDQRGRQHPVNLVGRFNAAKYLSSFSDVVALMVLEHQTQMMNWITRLGWKARIFPGEPHTREIDELVAYMLFADEAPLSQPVAGVTTFAKTFSARGPRDPLGRSLRDCDLTKRLFRFPLSYMIYSPAFDALPRKVLDRVYARLFEVLSGRDMSTRFQHLSPEDRRNVTEILRDTKPAVSKYVVR